MLWFINESPFQLKLERSVFRKISQKMPAARNVVPFGVLWGSEHLKVPVCVCGHALGDEKRRAHLKSCGF